VDAAGRAPVDLLEEVQATLAELDPLLLGRTVNIEMARLRVQADPVAFRPAFRSLVAHLLTHSEPSDSITVRVARSDQRARIEVFDEDGRLSGDDLPDLAAVAKELLATGGEIGTVGPVEAVVGWMTLPLATGPSSSPDA
jgi:hypothetical protein